METKASGHVESRSRLGFITWTETAPPTMRNKPFDYAAEVERAPLMTDAESKMSTTSHKSNTRIQSEAAMKNRVHTSRQNRDLTADGLDKHHHEAVTLKVLAKASKAKAAVFAKSAKSDR
jgi:hypothetical protein